MTNKKSQDARTQLHVWGKLLEGRIALQKVVVAVKDLERTREDVESAEEVTRNSITKLISCLVRLRDKYRAISQFALEDTRAKDVEDKNTYADIDDDFLAKRHNDYNKIRNEIIEKWYEKTKINTIPKKGYTAMELPTIQLIQNALKDKDRLIRRTQLDRTSLIDDSYHSENFNDDDFYHHLLKEVICKEDKKNWIEIQRLRYKSKRKADTKATKGRKIKKDLVPKLVNFMAPTRPANVSKDFLIEDEFRDTLIRSLFGGISKPLSL